MKHLRGYDFYAAPNLLFFFQKAMAAWVDMLFTGVKDHLHEDYLDMYPVPTTSSLKLGSVFSKRAMKLSPGRACAGAGHFICCLAGRGGGEKYLNFRILMQGVLSLKFIEYKIIHDLHVLY